ncbi:MAG: TrmH family RNA methyltransferase, partial [Candidatus Colwellbacteria bacterium]|nr:TrmH family RNA methyltransferase [Candidatus Colwellbacteria bacterium]
MQVEHSLVSSVRNCYHNDVKLSVILDNIRSAHNVGSIFRTADAVGVEKIFLCGVTPAPIDKFGRPVSDIAKVALGAEKNIPWEESKSTALLIR